MPFPPAQPEYPVAPLLYPVPPVPQAMLVVQVQDDELYIARIEPPPPPPPPPVVNPTVEAFPQLVPEAFTVLLHFVRFHQISNIIQPPPFPPAPEGAIIPPAVEPLPPPAPQSMSKSFSS